MYLAQKRRPVSMQRNAITEGEKLVQAPAPKSRASQRTACPACGGHHPMAPFQSRTRGPGTVEHDWRCDNCGHEWTTRLGPTSAPNAIPEPHRFPVGTAVRLIGRYGAKPAPMALFEVTGLRPTVDGEHHYRIRSAIEAWERVAAEHELVGALGHRPGS